VNLKGLGIDPQRAQFGSKVLRTFSLSIGALLLDFSTLALSIGAFSLSIGQFSLILPILKELIARSGRPAVGQADFQAAVRFETEGHAE
jgi:predicted tellurium resistance membrane protein TerC